MLYFSKTKIIVVIIISIIFTFLTLSNFFKFDDSIIEKKINLGLDLQGGSYLLLEMDNAPVVLQRLQNKLSLIRKYLKDENIKFSNLKIENNEIISFKIEDQSAEKLRSELEDQNSSLNPYYQRFKTHEFDFDVNDEVFNLKYSKYGLIELKNTSLNQALEIVRRRIDEVGTNEPNILRRGTDRILVELPGLR